MVALADLHAASFPRGWSESEIAALADQNGMAVRVARTVGQPKAAPVGFNFVRQTGDEAEILSIAVHRDHRRRGIAEKLMRDAMMRLRADRVSALFLEVAEDNLPAVTLYRQLGFETVGMRPAYYAPHVERADGDPLAARNRTSALVMRYDLEAQD